LAAKKEGTVEQALFNSWKENPRLVGGIRRLDSDITEETGGLFFAKEGADGLLWLQSLSDEPITILIKLGFGYKERYLAFGIFTELLRLRTRLKAKNAPIHPDLERLFGYLGLWVQNNLQKHQTLGLAEV
jgi:L-asparaginase II